MNGRNRAGRVVEQQELWGGSELQVRVGPKAGAVRRLSVDGRWKTGFAAALAIVVEAGRREEERLKVPPRTQCPRCGRHGLTEEDFGTRWMNGQLRTQSWCRACRGNKRVVPRRYGQEDWLSTLEPSDHARPCATALAAPPRSSTASKAVASAAPARLKAAGTSSTGTPLRW